MRILLAMDASQASQTALEQIASRPWPDGSSFEIVSVVEPSHLWTTSETAQEAASRAEELVQQAVLCLKARQENVKGITLFGNPKAAIIDRAKTSGSDFIFVGSHGASVLKRFLLGSVAASVLREAPCSVEVVRAGKTPIQKILLATDGSEFSNRAAQSIAARPWPSATEIRVLSAVELALPASYALFQLPNIDTAYLESQRGEAIKRAQDAIANARGILEAAGLNSSESVSVLLDPPRTIILNEAADWGADLIVVGSHGHGRIDRLLLGSVSEAVAMHADCPVEVIRARAR